MNKDKLHFTYLDINEEHTLITFIPKIFQHKFFIRVDNPIELVKIICYIDKHEVLRNIFKQIHNMDKSIDKELMISVSAQLSLLIGMRISASEYKKVFDMVSEKKKETVRILYRETRANLERS